MKKTDKEILDPIAEKLRNMDFQVGDKVKLTQDHPDAALLCMTVESLGGRIPTQPHTIQKCTACSTPIVVSNSSPQVALKLCHKCAIMEMSEKNEPVQMMVTEETLQEVHEILAETLPVKGNLH